MYVTTAPPRRTLEFGLYRDGDNNLDEIQESTVDQAVAVSRRDPRIAFTVEDTNFLITDRLTTDDFELVEGTKRHEVVQDAKEMSDPTNLAAFVAHTLDDAERCHAKQTWIDLVDHGGGDGGGLETSDGHVMPMPELARAVAQGVALHARAHPEDAGRGIDGVVANQCLMATMGFADALSRAGVKYLAASPETMFAPGVPTSVAEAIAANENDPSAMAGAVVGNVMDTAYDAGPLGKFGPAAAFDVLDLDPRKIGSAEAAIKRLNDALVARARDSHARDEIRADTKAVDGMARISSGAGLPWRADRPAIEVYDRFASDARLGAEVRGDAAAAARAVRNIILGHRESRSFGPVDGTDYRDAVGPTIHMPTSRAQIDPWAPRVRETTNAFYRAVDAPALTRTIA
jgi:hypothetical protein